MRRTDFVSDLVQEIERHFDEHGIGEGRLATWGEMDLRAWT